MYHKSIKYIFLDVGYTLCYPKTGSWRFTPLFFELIDRAVFDSISESRKNAALSAANELLFRKHMLSTQQEEYLQNIEAYTIIASNMAELSLSTKDIKKIAYDRTYNMDNYVFYDGVQNLVSWLSNNYKLGIISDAWPSSRNILKYAGLWEYFDTCTLSCDIGICKPNIAIYKKALTDASINPSMAMFVDDVEKNLFPALRLGMQPIKVKTVDKTTSRFDSIDSITDLKKYLTCT